MAEKLNDICLPIQKKTILNKKYVQVNSIMT